MPTNDFLLWACGGSPNLPSQSAYAGGVTRTKGHVSGVASAQFTNKSARQSSIMAAMIAQFIIDQTAEDVIDDGTIADILESFEDAIIALVLAGLDGGTITNVILQNVRELSQDVNTDATTTLDYALGGVVNLTHDINVTTLAFANLPPAGQVAVFNIERHKDTGGTARTIAWPATIKWPGGTPPPLTQTSQGWDEITLKTRDGGATWSGSYNCGLS